MGLGAQLPEEQRQRKQACDQPDTATREDGSLQLPDEYPPWQRGGQLNRLVVFARRSCIALEGVVPTKPVFFVNAAALRRWFAKHAATAPELMVGFMKKGTGVPSITWPEAVDEALCVGWIDGIRRSIDDKRYSNRFTPRKRGSHWSDINIRRVATLKAAGRMKPAGLAAFAGRNRATTGGEWYTQRTTVKLSPAQIKEIRRNAAAWKYYDSLPPSYRKMAHWWIASAKKAETRARRLRRLIEACVEGRRLY